MSVQSYYHKSLGSQAWLESEMYIWKQPETGRSTELHRRIGEVGEGLQLKKGCRKSRIRSCHLQIKGSQLEDLSLRTERTATIGVDLGRPTNEGSFICSLGGCNLQNNLDFFIECCQGVQCTRDLFTTCIFCFVVIRGLKKNRLGFLNTP